MGDRVRLENDELIMNEPATLTNETSVQDHQGFEIMQSCSSGFICGKCFRVC